MDIQNSAVNKADKNSYPHGTRLLMWEKKLTNKYNILFVRWLCRDGWIGVLICSWGSRGASSNFKKDNQGSFQ